MVMNQCQGKYPRETYCVITYFLNSEERFQECAINIFYFHHLFQSLEEELGQWNQTTFVSLQLYFQEVCLWAQIYAKERS